VGKANPRASPQLRNFKLTLDVLRQRADWQNLTQTFPSSGFRIATSFCVSLVLLSVYRAVFDRAKRDGS
jgi:hypothetical protein